MILQALNNLYLRKKDELPPEGFERKEIPFLIILDLDGHFKGLQDTRSRKGKKLIARQFRVPKEYGRSGKNAWQVTNLLWDHYGYVLEWPKSDSDIDKEMARKQHNTFMSEIETLQSTYPDDKEIMAVYLFLLCSTQKQQVFNDPLWSECKKIPGCNLSFCLNDKTALICDNDNVREYVANSIELEDEDDDTLPSVDIKGVCLITGESSSIARLHPRTPIAGAKSNAKLVSFQKNMGFDSYGKQQSYNSPTSKRATFSYTTVLNHMLAKDSRQKLYVGDATTVFWAESSNTFEDIFASLFGEPSKENPEQMNKAIYALYSSPETGAPPLFDKDYTPFYVLGLAPNSARIAIRFWHAGTVDKTARNIRQHFNDCDIVHGPKKPEHLSLFQMIISTAVQGKQENIQPKLAGDFMKAILTATPYPKTLLSSVISRIRAEQSGKDNNGKSVQNVSYPRAALIKACLVRETRYFNQHEREVSMALDTDNMNIGYRLGRLFAVLEKIQEEANPGINSTIRDRFYGSASGTPVAAFPTLMRLKNHHLAKLENRGRAVNFEKLIGEIIDGVKDFSTHLSLQDQGRFAVGYYHQRQDFFTKKTTEKEDLNDGRS
ncbi:MAG: type I-C CRISPR-associated protein Cas8c/Csd1 [Nitrospirae bacterium]|nr:type I-C CRISPR-associated protein Cas8c/Csd1 [Nitrospirota bacterium]